MLFKLVLSLILALLAVLFVVQNVAVVEVRFLLWGLHMTLSLLIFLLFGCGIIVGWLMHSYWAYRRKAFDQHRKSDATLLTKQRRMSHCRLDPVSSFSPA